MTNKVVIKLKETDILGNVMHIPIVGINQMYRGTGKSRILTAEARKYKSFIKDNIDEISKHFLLPTKGKLFIYIKFFLHIPLTQKEELDQRYIRDVDNLFKPIQDSLEGHKKFWDNDKKIRGVAGVIEENKYDYSRIEIYTFKYEESVKLLDTHFLEKR